MTKFSALQLRKAEGKAGHQATQFIGALVVVAMIVMVMVVVMILIVMMVMLNDDQ